MKKHTEEPVVAEERHFERFVDPPERAEFVEPAPQLERPLEPEPLPFAQTEPAPELEPAPEAAPEPAPAPEQPPPAPEAPLLPTVDEHAKAVGHAEDVAEFFRVRGMPGVKTVSTWMHGAAAQLHGWNAHKQHSAEPLRISREDYLAAIAAAEKPDERGEYAPHAPALSPYAPKSEAP